VPTAGGRLRAEVGLHSWQRCSIGLAPTEWFTVCVQLLVLLNARQLALESSSAPCAGGMT
jgi:hypothetical protein